MGFAHTVSHTRGCSETPLQTSAAQSRDRLASVSQNAGPRETHAVRPSCLDQQLDNNRALLTK